MIDEREIDGHRIIVQTELVRGEGTYAFLECCTCKLNYQCEVLKRNEWDGHYGRGATAAVRAILKRLT